MNLRRGLFRLWLVVSILWMVAVFALGLEHISRDIDQAELMRAVAQDTTLVPVFCSKARGMPGTDYATTLSQPGPWDKYANPLPQDACWYELSSFRRLWPEYADLSDETLTQKLYREAGSPLKQIVPYDATKRIALVAILPPLAIFLLGCLLLWVVSGFRPSKPVQPGL